MRQKVELSPYATKSGHEFAHTCFGNAAGEWACEPIRLLAKGPRVLDHIAVEQAHRRDEEARALSWHGTTRTAEHGGCPGVGDPLVCKRCDPIHAHT